jgi:hypothetical protein
MAHKLDMEPVTDPLAFLHESLRSAFNLDENLKQIKKPLPKPDNKAAMAANVKGETDAVTPTAMARIPSQSATGAAGRVGETKVDNKDDPWRHSNVTLDQLRVMFGDDEWDELFLSQEKQLDQESKFYDSYRSTSDRWRKIVEGQDGALTDTSTDKSKSPEVASDKELPGAQDKKATGKKVAEDDPWMVSLEGIEGLDLTGLEDLSPFEEIDKDVVMGDTGSPFESVNKTQLSAGERMMEAMGVDVHNPGIWSQQDRELADFLLQS